MEELIELRNCIEQQRYADALVLIGEMEEMSKEDKINKIYSYLEILLLHLIKKSAEQRTTRSWELSIRNSIAAIQRVNKRRQSGGYYLTSAELMTLIEECYPFALSRASLEAFGGVYDEHTLASQIDNSAISKAALELIQVNSYDETK
jgi:hypothetical protein